MSHKPTTLNDVAALAGVSYQTVSRVLNNSGSVSEKTLKKVHQAMTELNYTPNRVAQQLAGKQTFSIGLATTELSLQAPSQIASSIKKRANYFGYQVMIAMAEDTALETVRSAVNELLSQRVDGLIINIPLTHEQVQVIDEISHPTPVIFMDISPNQQVFSTMLDANMATQLGVKHLFELGHKNIALINGPSSSISANLRYQGWITHLNHYGLTPSCVYEGDWSAASGFEITEKMLHEFPQTTAILVANDQMALGVLHALHKGGIQIPAEMSVIGYDDTEDSANYFPPLTTIKQDFKQLGCSSVEMLIQALSDKSLTQKACVLSPSLVTRQTTSSYRPSSTDPVQLAEELQIIARKLKNLA